MPKLQRTLRLWHTVQATRALVLRFAGSVGLGDGRPSATRASRGPCAAMAVVVVEGQCSVDAV